ncbi:MAG: ADP-forming succinate--CoA ligase subunit beta [Deltaproteobacteria bacterium]|nr:ADP-forming succinate--CoA ligase subunit beta [Deltaproteobacteria bacterium]
MKIHEHQAKDIFRKHGIPVPEGRSAFSLDEAENAARAIAGQNGGRVVVKAQIHAGGRGKGTVLLDGKETGGGVRVVTGADEAVSAARQMLGGRLVTIQNKEGQIIRRLLIEQGVEFTTQFYLGLLVDRSTRRQCFIASREGGVEIEKVAAERPEAIVRIHVDPITGYMGHVGRRLAAALGLEGAAAKQCAKLAWAMCRIIDAEDASLVEINPLVVTTAGDIMALDAKITMDDNAAFRHGDWAELADEHEEDPVELEARSVGLSFVKLDGNIGCLVNGAGLAMATMDIIKYEGGEPANFLDVGGTANQEAVMRAFKIILSDPNVKAILVNIFGGIMSCRVIAEGVVGATRELGLSVPLVVRLEGNEVEEGKKILSESGLDIIPATGMQEAARKVVGAATGGGA